MRKNFVFHAAYFLVTRAFTVCLIWFIIVFIRLFDAPNRVTGDSNDVQLMIHNPVAFTEIKSITEEGPENVLVEEAVLNNKGDSIGYRRYSRNIHDTVKLLSDKYRRHLRVPVYNMPAGLFYHSGIVHAYYAQARSLLLVLAWLFILFQVYLILDDLKKDIYFAEKNARRVRKAGYGFMALFFLNLIRFEYTASLFSTGELLIDKKGVTMRIFAGDSFFYLSVGALILVLSIVFTEGSKIEEENKLTV